MNGHSFHYSLWFFQLKVIYATFVYIQIPFITTTSQTSYCRLPQHQVTHPLLSWGYGLHHIHFGQVQALHHLLRFLLPNRSAMKLLWRWRWCQESNLEFFLWCATLAQKRLDFSWESLVGHIKSATSPWEGCTSKHKLDNSLHYRNIWFCGIPLSGFAMNVSFSFQAHPHTCVKRCFCFSAWCYVLFRRRAFVANPVCWGKKRLLYLKSMCPPWAAWTLWKEVQKNKSTQLGFRFESWFFHDLLR